MSVSIAAHSWAGRQTKARVQPTKCIYLEPNLIIVTGATGAAHVNFFCPV